MLTRRVFRIRRLHDEPDVEMLVRSIEQPLATKRLRAVREGLEQLISKLERFRQSVEVEARRAATSTPFASIEVPSSGGNFETDSDAA